MAEDYNELNHDEECWLPKAKDISVWHFDKWKVDKPEDVYTDVCTFDLDFSADIKKALDHIVTTKIPDRHYEFWEELGHPFQFHYTDSTKKLNYSEYPSFNHIVEHLGLVEHPDFDVKVKLFRQKPGQFLPSHIDNFKKSNEDEVRPMAYNAKRFAVALEDWDFGQYWHFGNAFWHQWKKGNCVHWHRTMAHGTANVGHSNRHTLQVTGIPSAKTEALLNKN